MIFSDKQKESLNKLENKTQCKVVPYYGEINLEWEVVKIQIYLTKANIKIIIKILTRIYIKEEIYKI